MGEALSEYQFPLSARTQALPLIQYLTLLAPYFAHLITRILTSHLHQSQIG